MLRWQVLLSPAQVARGHSLWGGRTFYRGAIEAKCAYLTPGQMIERSAPPSAISVVGLVRHLREMERALARRRTG